MKVSKRSWHYKLVSIIYEPDDTRYLSLCSYIWMVVWSCCAAVLVLTLLPVCVCVMICCLPFLLAYNYCSYWSHQRRLRRRDELSPPKPSNIFMAWFQAKKEKVCPIIELVD